MHQARGRVHMYHVCARARARIYMQTIAIYTRMYTSTRAKGTYTHSSYTHTRNTAYYTSPLSLFTAGGDGEHTQSASVDTTRSNTFMQNTHAVRKYKAYTYTHNASHRMVDRHTHINHVHVRARTTKHTHTEWSHVTDTRMYMPHTHR